MQKRCSICKADKDEATEFYLKDKKTGRLFSWCKGCHNKQGAKRYDKNREAKLAAMKAKREAKLATDSEAVRAAGREANKRWREANPEAARAALRRSDAKRRENGKRKAYLKATKAQIAARQTKYREANKDAIDAYNRAYREANRETLRIRSAEWRAANPEAYKAITTRWKQANKAIINAGVHRYRARYRGCAEHHTPEEWESLKAACEFTCLCCGRREPDIKLTKDHIVPLSHAGTSNAITNIQPLCMDCNNRKGDTVADYRSVPIANEEADLDALEEGRVSREDKATEDVPVSE